MNAIIVKEESEAANLPAIIDKEALSSEEKALSVVASAIVVVDQGSYDLAMDKSKICGDKIKIISGYYDPRIKQANDLHKGLISDKKGLVTPWEKIKDKLDSDSTKWYKAEEAKAAEEKRKVEEELRRQAEEAQIRAAEALQKDGLFSAADEIMEAAPVIARVVVDTPAKADGVYYQDRWSAEVSSLMELVKAVAAGTVPIAYIMANDTALNAWARATKGTESIPGVKAQNTPSQGRRG